MLIIGSGHTALHWRQGNKCFAISENIAKMG